MRSTLSSKLRACALVVGIAVLSFGTFASVASATHSWGGYHWARTTSSFTLKLGDNVSNAWDPYLVTTSNDWSVSTMLKTSIVAGFAKGNCRPTAGQVEVCNKAYGTNGWLGIASIWVSGTHITQGTVKVNDTYFNTSTYNKSEWRQFVMCQEVGHTFGLDHQDETFSNPNLGTCMDYTNDPSGTIYNQLSNLHPNLHDYDELALIYAHLDPFTTLSFSSATKGGAAALLQSGDFENASEWGREIRRDSRGHSSLFERDLGSGNKVFTFVMWAQN